MRLGGGIIVGFYFGQFVNLVKDYMGKKFPLPPSALPARAHFPLPDSATRR